jgi:predicted type IV restriction endonuclease
MPTQQLFSYSMAKMLSLAQHADYAQHLSVYAVSCTVHVMMMNCISGVMVSVLA